MFLKGVWFIIAGVLLLGHTSALAEPYLRVHKNGVVYYHFSSREPPQSRRAAVNASALASVPPRPLNRPTLQESSPRHHLPPAALQGAPGLRPVRPGTAEDLLVANPYDAKENIWAATRYLVKWLTKFSYRFPLTLPASDAGPQLAAHQEEVPFLQEPQDLVPDVCDAFLNYPPEQPAQLGRLLPGSDYASGSLRYSFPVAGPFSFRDTWGEWRSGGRHHRAVDIFAGEGTEVYAVTSGVIHTLATHGEAGIILLMQGQDGRGYGYMHLQAYAAGIVEGKAVRTGEVIAYVGRTGLRDSAAHLHFQVYADNRLCKDDLLNPYGFLVQVCQGIGVTDLYQPKIARLEDPGTKVNRIRVYRRPGPTALKGRARQFSVKDSSITVIKNF